MQLFKKSSNSVRAWWHRCAHLPRETIIFFSLFHVYHVLDTIFFTEQPKKSPAPKFGPGLKTLQNALYILNFSKKVWFSFERGDIDVRPSHTKSLLFLTLSNVSRIWPTFFGYHHVWEQWKAQGIKNLENLKLIIDNDWNHMSHRSHWVSDYPRTGGEWQGDETHGLARRPIIWSLDCGVAHVRAIARTLDRWACPGTPLIFEEPDKAVHLGVQCWLHLFLR